MLRILFLVTTLLTAPIFGSVALASDQKVLSESQNAEIFKFFIVRGHSLKISVDIKSDSDQALLIKAKTFDFPLFILSGVVTDNLLQPNGATAHVGGVSTACEDKILSKCTMVIETWMFYKGENSFLNEVGSRKISIDFQGKFSEDKTHLIPVSKSITILVNYIAPE